ncbi:MAG: PIN domain-containing protein [Armatimonadetes bacterium]|nr:PIN domain-containing protein [Armatimonadota bacterium]
MLVLVDSSCWVEALRPNGDAAVRSTVDTWLAEGSIAVCAPVFAEVLRGVRKPDVRRVRRTLESLHYLETHEADWRQVIRLSRALADVAQHVPLVDLVVAVVATGTEPSWPTATATSRRSPRSCRFA